MEGCQNTENEHWPDYMHKYNSNITIFASNVRIHETQAELPRGSFSNFDSSLIIAPGTVSLNNFQNNR